MAEQQLTATVTLSSGATQAVTADASWQSDDTDVATVTAGGLVESVGVGTCTVTAAYSGLTATSAITVTDEPEALSVTPPTATLDLGA